MSHAQTTQSDRVYRALNPNGNPFSYDPKVNMTLETIGLVLWMSEGDKTQLSLSNGNVTVIKSYLAFLRDVCRLKEDKIKAVIHCHDTLSYSRCLSYWSRITNIPKKRFNKPFIKKDKGGNRTYPYGILRIVASNSRLIRIFNERLKSLGLVRC